MYSKVNATGLHALAKLILFGKESALFTEAEKKIVSGTWKKKEDRGNETSVLTLMENESPMQPRTKKHSSQEKFRFKLKKN
jgi:hypothetical protein